ncbi:uncharacterized protein [Antedon mediterranea]|uniref:uncharacterized protein isoform X2 n=1 Tax=Antedon mediterranea TaxID=105859 RepID=UPI003AF6B148
MSQGSTRGKEEQAEDSWRVKTLEEILEEKKRRKEKEELKNIEKPKPMMSHDQEERNDDFDSLDIKPPQLPTHKGKKSHKKDDRRERRKTSSQESKNKSKQSRNEKEKSSSSSQEHYKSRSKDRRNDPYESRSSRDITRDTRESYSHDRHGRQDLRGYPPQGHRESDRDRWRQTSSDNWDSRGGHYDRNHQRGYKHTDEYRRHGGHREGGSRSQEDGSERSSSDRRDRKQKHERDRSPHHRQEYDNHASSRERRHSEDEPHARMEVDQVTEEEEEQDHHEQHSEDAVEHEQHSEEEEEQQSSGKESGEESGGSESDSDESEEDSDEEESDEEGEEEEEEESGTEESESESASSSESEEGSGSEHSENAEVVADKDKRAKSKFEQDSSPEPQIIQPESTPPGNYLPDSPPVSPVELKPELPTYLPAISGCRSVEEFTCLNRIEEGTYGVVYRAKDKKLDEVVALKRLKMEKEKEGFPITSLREINTLLKSQHMNIVTVREIVVGSNMDKIYIVMDYVEHDLKTLMETMKQPFTQGESKCLLKQLLDGVHHLHDNWILHRDLKTSNLLLSHKGILKIGDFGLAREYGSPLKPYTPIVVTLWYRAPELLLGIKEYACPIDMWSVGCIFAEFLTMKPLFPGKSEVDQLNRIFKELGTPSEKIWPGYNELPAVKKMTFADHPYNNLRSRFGTYLTDVGFELMNKFLTYNPGRRITADEAKKHEYFRERPLPIDPSMFPTWPAKSEMARVKKSSPKAPEGGQQYKNLDDDEAEEGFRLTLASQGAAQGLGFSLKF